MSNKIYFCVGCRQVHNDEDYSEENGDLLIVDWNRFAASVERINMKKGQ